MASNRIRALRNVSNRLTRIQSRLSYLDRRPAPRRLADNFIFTNNIQRVAIVEPLVAPDAITNEKLTDDSVQTDEIELDAMTGKNINSCTITDSTFSNGDIFDSSMSNITAENVEGTNFTLETVEGTDFEIDGLVLINGEITETTLDGAEVVLTGCTLSNCLADTITAIGSGMTIVAAPLAVDGSFAVTGSTVMTVGDGAFGVTVGGTGISLSAGTINIDAGSYTNVSFNGQIITPYQLFVNEVADIYQAIAAVQSSVDALGPCACP